MDRIITTSLYICTSLYYVTSFNSVIHETRFSEHLCIYKTNFEQWIQLIFSFQSLTINSLIV